MCSLSTTPVRDSDQRRVADIAEYALWPAWELGA
jgi:hypothetical protein